MDACPNCTEAKMIIKGISELTQSMKQFYGPDGFIANTFHPNPMKVVSIDEAGPFYLLNSQGEHDKIYNCMCRAANIQMSPYTSPKTGHSQFHQRKRNSTVTQRPDDNNCS